MNSKNGSKNIKNVVIITKTPSKVSKTAYNK